MIFYLIKNYDIYDSDNTLLNDKFDEEIEKIFVIKKPIKIIIKKYSLKLPQDNREYIYHNTSVTGTLLFNNPSLLGIFIYNIKLNQIFSYEYPFKDYGKVKFINRFTSFCNTCNFLYMSGGENENEGQNIFIKINLEDTKQNELSYIELTKLNFKRYWHSMIFIPEKYVFIVGGAGVKECELYDIEENEIIEDKKLNYERCEPSLILVNNKYLYCFCGYHFLDDNFMDTIEKCNLYKKERNWEIVNYQVKTKKENATGRSLIISFFGISYINDNIILNK